MRQRFETKNGAWTYALELELDAAKRRVIRRSEQYLTGEPRTPNAKSTKRTFPTIELAQTYFRYAIATTTWPFVEGDPVELVPGEDFKHVKDTSRAYRYLEHPEKGMFWDIDRDSTEVITVEGTVGTAGTQQVVVLKWDGEARAHYKRCIAARLAAGYVPRDGKK